jgi:DNA primase
MADLAPYLDQIRSRLKVSEIVGKDVRLTRKGNEFSGLCPFHKEKTPSFTLNDAKGFYHCFGCGAHGDALHYVMQRSGMNFMDAVEHLAQLAGVVLPEKKSISSDGKVYYEILRTACEWYEENLKRSMGEIAREYLNRRGFTLEIIEEFHLGFAPDKNQSQPPLYKILLEKGFQREKVLSSGLIIQPDDGREPYDRFRGRVMFPIHDLKGNVIAFGGRVLGDGQPKYLNSSDTSVFHKGQILYNFAQAQRHVTKDQPLIVVEGYFDVIALHQAGFKAAVAPLGTALTEEQLALLWKRNTQPLFCFDGDSAGLSAAFRAAKRALPLLTSEKTLRFCYLPKGEDPDSFLKTYGKEAFVNVLNSSGALSETLWNSLMMAHQPSAESPPEEKAAFKKNVNTAISEIVDADVRHFYFEDFNEKLRKLWYKGKTASFTERSSAKPMATLIQGHVLKKNMLSQKILLATLINHPTLLYDIAEQFALVEFGKESWQQLKQHILQNLDSGHTSLKEELHLKGFSSILEEVLDKKIYIHAPFAQEGTDSKVALERWQEIWHRVAWQESIKKDIKSSSESMKVSFDEQEWQKMKALKSSLAHSS